jgi:molybdopterin synthase sulfur carrier subunit
MMKQVNLQLFGAFSDLDASREIAVDGPVAPWPICARRCANCCRCVGRASARACWTTRRLPTSNACCVTIEALPDDGRVAILPPVSGAER